MNRFKHLALATFAVAGLAASGAASALTWIEAPPGAGELTSTAQITNGLGLPPLESIQGVLNTSTLVDAGPRNEVDVYRIYIDDYTSFSARTVSSNPDDTALFLFDKAGKGVYMNDDNGVDLLSTLPAGGPLVNDYYYIAVAIGGFSAWDAASGSVFLAGGFTDVLGADPAAGALASWTPGFATWSEGGLAYTIDLTGARVAAIPEPSTVLMLVLGLGGIVAARRTRKV